MRRGKKTSIPASLIAPALRSATKAPEALASPVGSSAADASSLRDSFQAAQAKSKASNPASSAAAASQTRSAPQEPEVPADPSSGGFSAAGATSLRDLLQVARPENKTPNPASSAAPATQEPEAPADPSSGSSLRDPLQAAQPPLVKLPGPGSDSDSASALGSETHETQESPPPPPLIQDSVDSGPCARGLALQPDKMFSIFRSIPTQMDYKGQKLAEQIFQGIILVSAVIGFIYGYITEQFGWTVYIVMAGFALSCLLTLPPWPIYRRNPLKWLPVQEPATDDKKPADRKVKRHSKN
ncbi:signal peptidase complex subunit 1 [Heteronotia binoei]|uniref:signal peptidase complex subunit 1 n=1 Tax=Heteronotia binoei TaxID=13085 RepID=UPI00292DC8BC|nr:signal peptidase complex subunit 1 [Heteronotia binoei]